jgi:hypothetical protein
MGIDDRRKGDDEREREAEEKRQAAEHLKQGLGLLFQAAREVATGVKKELGRTDWGKTLDDAGRELVRATAHVVERVGTELKAEFDRAREQGKPPPGEPTRAPGDEAPGGGGEGGEEKGEEKPKGPTGSDPGFRIAVDEEEKGEGKKG